MVVSFIMHWSKCYFPDITTDTLSTSIVHFMASSALWVVLSKTWSLCNWSCVRILSMELLSQFKFVVGLIGSNNFWGDKWSWEHGQWQAQSSWSHAKEHCSCQKGQVQPIAGAQFVIYFLTVVSWLTEHHNLAKLWQQALSLEAPVKDYFRSSLLLGRLLLKAP